MLLDEYVLSFTLTHLVACFQVSYISIDPPSYSFPTPTSYSSFPLSYPSSPFPLTSFLFPPFSLPPFPFPQVDAIMARGQQGLLEMQPGKPLMESFEVSSIDDAHK